MTGRPILQTQFEKRLWKSINGGGPLGGLNAKRNTPQSMLESVLSHEGTVSAGVLVALMDLLDSQGLATTEDLRHIVSKSRPTDCTPSVRASGILLERGEMEAAGELLALSSRSQEVLSRSVAEARICMKAGDRAGAEAAALRAYGSDPSCAEAYGILAEVDPAGGWPQMHNIQQVLDGEQPTNPPGEGRVQDLYRIYYEWFRGSREAASDMLANSPHYKDSDRDYMLASARMSVDERDWHSARMMYARLLPGAPPFLTREVAEACMDAGRPGRAVELLAGCDQTSPKTLMDMFLARRMSGDAVETGIALRAYLDSEWVGSVEYLDMIRMLIGFGMDEQAAEVLNIYVDSCGPDSESMLLRSLLYERAGDCMSALVYAYDAARRDRESKAARARVAQVYFAMGDQVRAEKECSRILSESPDDPEALRLMVRIQSRKGDNVSVVSTCKRILESDPGDLGALLELARAQALTGDISGASDSAHRAVRTDGSLDTYVRALSALLSAGPGRDVSYLCREAETRFPESTEVKRIRGNLEYGEGEYLRASATFASALGDAPDDPVLWYSRGMADEARDDLESAEEAYDRALELDPDEPEYWISKAAVRERRGDNRGAVRALDRAAALDRTRTYPVIRKAMILSSEGRVPEALHLMETAARMDPGSDRVREEISRLRELAGRQAAEAVPEPPPQEYEDFEDAELFHTPSVEGPADVPEVLPEEEPVLETEEAPVQETLESFSEDVPEPVEEVVEPVAEPEPQATPEHEDGPVPEEETEEEPPAQEAGRSEDLDALYSLAFSLEESGDHRGALRTIDRALAADPCSVEFLKLKARVGMATGETGTAADCAALALDGDPDDADLHAILGRAKYANGDLEGALRELDTAVSKGADDADVHEARGEVLESMGMTDRASECYSAAVSRDPGRLDLAEKLARMMYARKESIAADGMLNRILRRDPRRMSAILLKAEIAHARNDEKALMAAYDYFSKCPSPGQENTVRMARILEESGHQSEAKALVVGKPQRDTAGNSVKRYAEKALRRAYAMKTSPTDPDLINALGLDPDTAAEVASYIGETPDCGPLSPGSERYLTMEARSRAAVLKLEWRDLEHNPRLPLERVFVQCGCDDIDEAKEIVAYVLRAMLVDPGRSDNPEHIKLAMGMPKGISVYEIVRSCDVGVHEAREIQAQVV